MTTTNVIYIDVDGVLADFDGAVKFYANVDDYSQDPVKVWERLEKVPNLFRRLTLLGHCWYLVDLAISLAGRNRVQYLTALPKPTECLVTAQADKVWWLHRYLPSIQANCVPHWSAKKYFCESSSDVLIDDSQRNIDDWVSKGGIGILHTSFESTKKELIRLDKEGLWD